MTSTNKRINLELQTWDNIDDVLSNAESSTEFFTLPASEKEADRHLGLVSNMDHYHNGHWFNAYDMDQSRLFVGGGQLHYPSQGAITRVGYWIAKAHRRKGYGSAVLAELEAEAINRNPHLERLELEIDRRNLGSIALAKSMGYELLYAQKDDEVVFWKIPS